VQATPLTPPAAVNISAEDGLGMLDELNDLSIFEDSPPPPVPPKKSPASSPGLPPRPATSLDAPPSSFARVPMPMVSDGDDDDDEDGFSSFQDDDMMGALADLDILYLLVNLLRQKKGLKNTRLTLRHICVSSLAYAYILPD
jgi:hypothetical protein